MAVFNKFRLISLAAALILVMGLVTACGEPSGGSTSQATPTPTAVNTVQPTATPDGQDVLYVIYFHSTSRCYGCIYAEDGIRWTIDAHFADEVADGKLVFMSIDWQAQANKAIVEKYGAYTSQLFMNKVTNGVENIEQVTSVWFYLGNDQAFTSAVKTEIEKRLE